ncbi:MAG: sodium:calcium antiporter [Candidatus Diapherotrites archaeon]|nr:sodium:calcium antiporter [Candidatus Diapherotrites archaeon]
MLLLFSAVVFCIALAVLVLSSRAVISSSIKLSEYFGISQLAVGFILIALVVSLPDLAVSVIAALSNQPELGIGDAIGSTVANICLVLGIATLVRSIKVERRHVLDCTELLLLIGAVPAIFLILGSLGRAEGIVLLLLFVIYCFFIVKERFSLHLADGVLRRDIGKVSLSFFLSLILVVISARFVVSSASDIALVFGLGPAVLGLTLISFGTTLPELAIDFTAIRRGQTALAIGDILGSSVVNLTLVLGSVLVINPIRASVSVFTIAICFVMIANTFLFYSLVKHEGIGKNHGIVFIILYILFLMASFGSKALG